MPTGAEAAFKYFLLGAFSSAFFLYGIAFAFAMSGSTRLDQIGVALSSQPSGDPPTFALMAVGLLAVGFCFKVSAVPFHMWTPDAYEGAPTIVTAFMSTGVKAAAFAAFVRVFLSPLEPLQAQWIPVLSFVAAVTMILGTVLGVVQTNVKRMLAYSAIAHAGYLLLGIIAASSTGKAAILFYLLTYAVSNLGALGIVALLGSAQHEHDQLRDFAGLWRSRPGLAALMTIFLLSLGGFPPMAGFIGKWYIFSAAVQEGHYWLAIIGVLTSVVSVFFYLRIVVMMYMTQGADTVRPRIAATGVAGLALATLAVFYLGILPTRVLDLALESISTIFCSDAERADGLRHKGTKTTKVTKTEPLNVLCSFFVPLVALVSLSQSRRRVRGRAQLLRAGLGFFRHLPELVGEPHPVIRRSRSSSGLDALSG